MLTILFLGLLLVLVLIVLNTHGSLAASLTGLQFVVHGLGAMIALSAALLMLLRALDRDAWSRMPPLMVPLVAGLLLVQPHWSLGVLLAVVAAGHFARDIARSSGAGGGGGSGQSRRFRRPSSPRRDQD